MKEVGSGNRRFCFTIENSKNTVKIPSFVVHLQEMNVGTDTMLVDILNFNESWEMLRNNYFFYAQITHHIKSGIFLI